VQALGGFVSKSGGAYWESDAFVCTFAVGHLLEFFAPEDIDPALKRWSLETLPILPRRFQRKAVDGQKDRLTVIKTLMERPDVTSLVNACDAAREGELIFRELVDHFECKKWVRRLWLSSMTAEAIRGGFAALRDGVDLDGLGAAAECRAKADWLIGMNATRAFSIRLRGRDERQPWSVGRVQTPTLALLVDRELEILSHVPRPFARVIGKFEAPDHKYEGTWFDPAFKADDAKPDAKDDRIADVAVAEAIAAAVRGLPGTATETREQSQRHAPPLYSLTALQKHMSTRFKWTAKRTLEAAQRCYEQHKVLTYPRTNSSCLPQDYRGEVARLIDGLAGHATYGEHARYLKEKGRRNEGRIFDDKGVDDHFAIIPTGKTARLSGDDEKVYDAVVRRFLGAFFPPAVYDRVKRTTVVEVAGETAATFGPRKHHFRTGPVETLAVPGWLAVWDRQADDPTTGKAAHLPPLNAPKGSGAPVTTRDAVVKTELTKPPPRITEAGLLTLMENAGRRVEDEEMASALMSAEGLGTAATRADIIQNLKTKEYVDQGLRPLWKGIHLITVLRRLSAHRLISPELTAKLELDMAQVEREARHPQAFMGEVEAYVTEVVTAARRLDLDRIYPLEDPVGRCPVCREGHVFERAHRYECQAAFGATGACGFSMPKNVFGRWLDRAHAGELTVKGETDELDGFRDKSGREVKAKLRIASGRLTLVGTGDGATSVPEEGEGRGDAQFSARGGPAQGARRIEGARSGGTRPILGLCPVHAALRGVAASGAGEAPAPCHIIETAKAYMCETRLKEFLEQRPAPSGFCLPKLLCGRPISAAEALAFAERRGSGEELAGFVARSGRPFRARLKMLPDGSFGFEFDKPLPPRAGATAVPPPRTSGSMGQADRGTSPKPRPPAGSAGGSRPRKARPRRPSPQP
jgi:DNA topoisomerase-3